jgi:hypothetical protein
MSALATHFDELLAVLRASARLRPSAGSPTSLRNDLADQLDESAPDLAARVRALDPWHTDTLADFLAEAHLLAKALGRPPAGPDDQETKVD